MKKILLFAVVVAYGQTIDAQPHQYLDANRIHAVLDTSGHLFRYDNYYDFNYPVGSDKSIRFNAFPIITGKKMSNAFAAQQGTIGPGPLLEGTATPSTDGVRWSNVWKVTIDDINDHLTNYTSSGYVPSTAIADWPAMGNTANGEPTLIAPFIDADADGVYDPMAGDYPDIKGTQTVFAVYNDNATGTPGLGLEIQCMIYAFDCPYDSALQNTVFAHYKIVNKGTSTYTDSYAGIFADINLGNTFDDYVGSDVKRGMFYFYNGDNFDEPDSLYGVQGYDSLLPVLGVVMLGGPWQDADENDNGYYPNDYYNASADNGICYKGLGLNYDDGIVDNERLGLSHIRSFAETFDIGFNMPGPMTSADGYYKSMTGWDDGTSLFYGGNGHSGYSGVTSTPSNFTYFDNTDPAFFATGGVSVSSGWNEISAGNSPANQCAFASTGSFTIQPGESNEMDFAFIGAFDYTAYHSPLAALPILQERADTIQYYFSSNRLPCGAFSYAGIHQTNEKQSVFSLYPNPSNSQLTVSVDAVDQQKYAIIDACGKVVLSGNINGNNTTINVSSFSPGIYTMRIDGLTAQRFVVQH